MTGVECQEPAIGTDIAENAGIVREPPGENR